MSTSRLEETRKRVQSRLAEIGEAADQEVKRTLRIRDAALALLGVVGLLYATKKVATALAATSGKKGGKQDAKNRRSTRL